MWVVIKKVSNVVVVDVVVVAACGERNVRVRFRGRA